MVTEPEQTSTEASEEPTVEDHAGEPTQADEATVHVLPGHDDEEATDELPAQAESEIEARLRQVSAAYVKLQDEMQSFRDRNERIQQERDRRRRGEVVAAMFEPLQNLRRSHESWGSLGLPDEAVQGLGLVLEQFQGSLRKLGLEQIAAAPAPFDPNIHDAICTMPVQHASLDGQVIQVFEAGYRVDSMVIQAARVIIGRYEAPVPEEQEAEHGDDGPGAEE